MSKNLCFLIVLVYFLSGCTDTPVLQADEETILHTPADTSVTREEDPRALPPVSVEPDFDTLQWTDVAVTIPSARLDIRYAGPDNFIGQAIYDCPRCLLRGEPAGALSQAATALAEQGYGIILYDCYRPAPCQERLWEANPDPRYVMPPWKGSNHSRGAAVDMTLYRLADGSQVDMGTAFDHFGREAHWSYKGLADSVRDNRLLLRTAMEEAGFRTISSEWWHYDYHRKFALADFMWACPE